MGVEVLNSRLICKRNVLDKQVNVRSVIRQFLDAKLQEVIYKTHIWTGNTLLCRYAVIFFSLVQKEVVSRDFGVLAVGVIRNFPRYVTEFNMVGNAVNYLFKVFRCKSVKFFKPIQIPPSAPELAVRYVF